eukprot:IDg3253t1
MGDKSGEIDGLVPAEVKTKYGTAFAFLKPSSFRSPSTTASQSLSTKPRLALKCTAADSDDESDLDEFVMPDSNDERRPLDVEATVGGELLMDETRFKPVYKLVEW